MNYADKLDRVLLLAGSLLDRLSCLERSRGRADAAKWNESDHPRAKDGKFGTGGGSAAYKEHAGINDWLRGERTPDVGGNKHNREMRDALDALIASTPLKAPIVTYRGYSDVDIQALMGGRSFIRDKAFTSTSTDLNVARDLQGSGYLAKFNLPAGQPAHQFDADHQGEVLLPRGQRFNLVGVDHRERMLTFVPAPQKA